MLLDQIINLGAVHARARYALVAQRYGYGRDLGPLLSTQLERLDTRRQTVLFILASEQNNPILNRVVKDARIEADRQRRLAHSCLVRLQVDYETRL